MTGVDQNNLSLYPNITVSIAESGHFRVRRAFLVPGREAASERGQGDQEPHATRRLRHRRRTRSSGEKMFTK